MTTLAIDTSMAVTSACVMLDDGRDFSTEPAPAQRLFESPQHSAELLPIIDDLLARAAIDWKEIESIAVGVGPGAFTGVRIGVSTARALAQSLGIPLRPVCSLEALAAGLARPEAPVRPLLGLIDARRREVFAALYREGAPEWGPVAISSQELLSRAGAEVSVLAAGDWALESKAALEAAGVEVPAPESGLHSVSARHLCLLGLDREPVAVQQVEPIYVRLPDAEINRRAAYGGV